MPTTVKKQVIDTFCEKLEDSFGQYCLKHELPSDLKRFTTYLIDQELIDHSAMRQYAVLKAYDELVQKGALKKTEAVNQLASRFHISERSIWTILRKANK